MPVLTAITARLTYSSTASILIPASTTRHGIAQDLWWFNTFRTPLPFFNIARKRSFIDLLADVCSRLMSRSASFTSPFNTHPDWSHARSWHGPLSPPEISQSHLAGLLGYSGLLYYNESDMLCVGLERSTQAHCLQFDECQRQRPPQLAE